ncbi:uncharacterized protein LOC126892851 [Diabrotica virgifera virgifera]|uniref:Uncharacterized protein LOC114343593 n=1 Tax=Diabrotica virgifera virgifera TaxID=50390 RepID=A0A6P7GW21_DIAVI|nr:uncharacterized protein LOC126892851 [Diabrotica virgifera virgifera]
MEANNPSLQLSVDNLEKPHRFSLQHNRSELVPSSFRQTQSQRYDSEGRRKIKKAIVIPPSSTIAEVSEEAEPDEKNFDQFKVENEKRNSKVSKKSEKSIYAFDNAAYDGNLDKRSISSRAGSSRQPSVQSLEVVREQYCCFARRTNCEKKLLVTVTILSIVIIVLVIVLALIASHHDIDIKSTIRDLSS